MAKQIFFSATVQKSPMSIPAKIMTEQELNRTALEEEIGQRIGNRYWAGNLVTAMLQHGNLISRTDENGIELYSPSLRVAHMRTRLTSCSPFKGGASKKKKRKLIKEKICKYEYRQPIHP